MKNTFTNPAQMLSEYLGLTAPVTLKELKSGYRKKAMEYHPDLNPNGTELFKEFQKVYDWLTSPGIMEKITVAGEVELVARTEDGVPLSELGLGFDNTKNGVDCPECNHAGYKRVAVEKSAFALSAPGAAIATLTLAQPAPGQESSPKRTASASWTVCAAKVRERFTIAS